MEYYEHIRKLRIEKNLTQQQLADKINISRQMINRYENGLNVPSLNHAMKLANFFDIDINELIIGSKKSSKKTLKSSFKWKTLLFIIFTFIPVILNYYFKKTIYYIERLFINNTSYDNTYKLILSRIENLILAILIIFISVLFIYWIFQLVINFYDNENKYSRFIIFKYWKIGLFFIITNSLITLYRLLYPIIFNYILLFIVCGAISIIILFILDTLLKKILKNKMTIEQNQTLNKINLSYTIILFIIAICYLIITILIFSSGGGGAAMSFSIITMILAAIVILIVLSYLIIRLFIISKINKHQE